MLCLEKPAPILQTKFGPSILQPLTAHCSSYDPSETTAILVETQSPSQEFNLDRLCLLHEVLWDLARPYLRGVLQNGPNQKLPQGEGGSGPHTFVIAAHIEQIIGPPLSASYRIQDVGRPVALFGGGDSAKINLGVYLFNLLASELPDGSFGLLYGSRFGIEDHHPTFLAVVLEAISPSKTTDDGHHRFELALR